MIEVITPWLGHPELIAEYQAAMRGARCIIVNQASDPETTRALCEMVERLGNRSTIIHNDQNTYYAAGNNQGLAQATGDIVVFANNDVRGASGGALNRWVEQVTLDVRPGALYSPAALAFDVDGEAHPYLEGWCLAGYRSSFRDIGGWNASAFPRAYAEDVELCWRARRHGLALYQTKWALEHIGNVTNSSTVDGYAHADQQREVFRNMVRAARRAAA
jgi:GT2 family glycosyltransferase